MRNRNNHILEEAAAQGIDVNFASGDYGDSSPVTGFKSASYPASSPYVTAVGGTSLALNPDNSIAWQAGWGANFTWISDTSGAGYAPYDPPQNFGFLLGSGGGPSEIFAKPSWQSDLPGAMRLTPDVSMVADTYTGAEVVETFSGQLSVAVGGGTSLACPMFSGLMAIAAQKAGHALGQVAPLLYNLPSSSGTSSAIYDVQPVGSSTNVTGSISDSAGTTAYSADQLVAPLDGTQVYYSALYHGQVSTHWYVLAFGADTSLATTVGWDDVTGVGTPNGANFVNALSGP
jgi:subtilase family serine protease